MDKPLNIGNFDFCENSLDISSEQLIENIFKSEKSPIKNFPFNKSQKLELIDAQFEIFELAKLNKAKVSIKVDLHRLIYLVEIENDNFIFQEYATCYKLQNILSPSYKITLEITPQNKIIIKISFNLKVDTPSKKESISTYHITSFEKVQLSKYVISEFRLKNAVYGSYPTYMDVSIKIDGEAQSRNATLLIESVLKIGTVKLLIPEEYQLDMSEEDYEKLESKFWLMYFHKALSSFYKNPSSLSTIKVVSQNLKYLRWNKNLSFFEGAKAIGVNLYTLYKLENGKFKPKDIKKINYNLLKNAYSIEKNELCIPENFIQAVNFEFMSNGYLEEKSKYR